MPAKRWGVGGHRKEGEAGLLSPGMPTPELSWLSLRNSRTSPLAGGSGCPAAEAGDTPKPVH